MGRKEAWNKAVKHHGRLKCYMYIVLAPVTFLLYALAFTLIFIGDIGEVIKFKLDNI